MRAALAFAILLTASCAAQASDTGAVIVIPGRAGVPVFINGVESSYAIVEGDWGLGKSVHVQPVVTFGWDEYHGKRVGHYFPGSGRTPGYGRLEVEPPANRRLPREAESYHRSWSAQSGPPARVTEPPFDPPPVILAPQINERGRPNTGLNYRN